MYRGYRMSVRKRNYALTFFTEPDINTYSSPLGDMSDGRRCIFPVVFMIYGKEVCPKTEKVHWQGYVQFNKAMTFGQIKKLFKDNTIHIEEEYEFSTPQRNIEYCCKGSMSSELFKSLKDPKEHVDFGKDAEIIKCGQPKIQGKRNDIHEIKEKVKNGMNMRDIIESTEKLNYQNIKCAELLMAYLQVPRVLANGLCVIWCYGLTGSGKSHYAKLQHPEAYVPVSSKWWDGYDGQKTVLIDDIRDDYSYRQLLRMTDVYSYKVERKGSSCEVQYDTIIFTCPWHPREFLKKFYSAGDNYDQFIRRITKVIEFEKVLDCPVEETFMYKCTEVEK